MSDFGDEAFSEFFDNAAVPLHLVGADGRILRANKAELELLGYSEEEYIGHHIGEFHADAPVIEDILCRLTNGEELRSYEARLRHKSGDVRHVLISSNVRRGPAGEFLHTRCFTRDITDRKRAEEARAHALSMTRLATHLQIAREDERRVLARQLHDELIAGLTVAAMDLHNVRMALEARGDPLARNLEMVMRLLQKSVDAKRRIIENLRPTILHELGLAAALRTAAQRFTVRTGIQCRTELADDVKMDEELALLLYRIAQQALDHATLQPGAKEAVIRLSRADNQAVLDVSVEHAPGSGAPAAAHIELEGCQQLLAGWGGSLSMPQQGRMVAVAPLQLQGTDLH